jgi:hypothetical protein
MVFMPYMGVVVLSGWTGDSGLSDRLAIAFITLIYKRRDSSPGSLVSKAARCTAYPWLCL